MKHQKRLFILLCLVVLLVGLMNSPSTPLVHAQSDSWTTTIWLGDKSGAYLQIVNGEGIIDTIQVSDNLVGPDPYRTVDVLTSDDNRYIVHHGIDLSTQSHFLRFGETGEGPCCQDAIDTIGDVLDIQLAGFEPDGSRFALSYIQSDEIDPPFSDGIVVVNAATGNIEHQIDIGIVMSVLGSESNPAWAIMDEWAADGILFLGMCYACDAARVGNFAVWNPDSTFIGETDIYGGFGSRLDSTGELLIQAQNTQYFYDPSPGPAPTPNVIQYYPTGDIRESSTVIYANTNTFEAGTVHWVADGRAFLVNNRESESWNIVFRDGTTATIESVGDMQFLSGSPDGWFVMGEDAGNPALFHYDIDTLELTLITWGNTGLVGLEITHKIPLGDSITSPTFAAISPPDVAQTARCPGFLPSRLVVGQDGRVTPGAANRMRSYAGADGEIVGSIPGGATFTVLEGPFCDIENQIAWWRVTYDGVEGWTAEGQGDTYWTQSIE